MTKLDSTTSIDILNIKECNNILMLIEISKKLGIYESISHIDNFEINYIYFSLKKKNKKDKRFLQYCQFYLKEGKVLSSDEILYLLSFKVNTEKAKDIQRCIKNLNFSYFSFFDSLETLLPEIKSNLLKLIDKHFTDKLNYKLF